MLSRNTAQMQIFRPVLVLIEVVLHLVVAISGLAEAIRELSSPIEQQLATNVVDQTTMLVTVRHKP